MTFEEKLTELLIQHGMFESQAQIVVDRMKTDENNKGMNGCWSHQVKNYPLQMLAILWWRAIDGALAYIDETCPKAFFRSELVKAMGKAP